MIQNDSKPLSKQQRQFIFFVVIGSALAVVVVASLLNRFLDDQFGPPNLDGTVTAVAIWSTQVAVVATQSALEATESALNASSIALSSLAPLPDTSTTWDGLHIEVIAVNGDAWPLIQAHNQFNDPPEAHKQMMMITLRVSNVAGPEEEFIRLSGSGFSLIGDQQTLYKSFQSGVRCGVIPNRLDGTLERGMMITGNVCLQVPKHEKELFLIYETSDYPDIYISVPMNTLLDSE